MIAFLFLLVCVHVVLIRCKAAPENTSPNATEGRRKKIKLRQSVSGEQYGVDLPAFAFDYSELLSSAVIERSDASRDLYLTIFLLGRQAAYAPGAVLALNTDQEPVLTWTTAMKRWSADRDLSSRSRLLCIIQNSDLSKAAPYQAPAYWLTLQMPPAGPMAFNRLIEAVRCKIRAPSTIYTNRTYDSERRLLVDLVRRDKANSSAADKALVSSFNMRWSVRQGGYGSMSIASNSMSYWTMSSNRSDAEVLKRTRTPSPSAALQTRSATSRARVIHACVPGVRPAKAGRAEVGMTMLLEFVEHLLLLGVQHVTLGVVLDVESLHMDRQLLLLQKYLLSGQLTISPLSLPKTDDAPGIAGVLLSDALSETFFLNHCLQMSKGLADYVLVLRAYQFIIPTAGTSTLAGMARRARPTNSSLLMGKYSKYGAEKPSSETSGEGDGLRRNTSIHSMFTRSRAKAKYQGSGRKDRETRRLAMVSSPTVTCSIVFQGYAAADPADAFFGPGDTAWTKDFYSKSPLQALRTNALSMRLLSTQYALAAEVGSEGDIVPICKAASTGNVAPGSTASSRVTVIEKAVPLDTAIAVSFMESVPSAMLAPSSASSSSNAADTQHITRDAFFQRLHTALAERGVSNLTVLGQQLAALSALHKGRGGGIKDRQSIKPPFWKSCEKQALADVVQTIFAQP